MCQRHQSGHRRLVHPQPIRFLVRRNLLPNGRASQKRPTLYSMNLGPACTHAGCMGHRRPVSARRMHALRNRQHSLLRVNKLFTTAWPLQIFVQPVAAWAHKHEWSVMASRIPGERNVHAGTHPPLTASRMLDLGLARMISGPINPRCLCIQPTHPGGRSISVLRKRTEEGAID